MLISSKKHQKKFFLISKEYVLKNLECVIDDLKKNDNW
jgi:hypothetical protein